MVKPWHDEEGRGCAFVFSRFFSGRRRDPRSGEMRGSQAPDSRPLTYPGFAGAPSSPALRERTHKRNFILDFYS